MSAPKRRKPRARKAAPKQAIPVSLRGLGDSLPWGSAGGPIVTPADAIRVTAILACCRFLAQSIASMPVHLMRTLPSGRKASAKDLLCWRAVCKRPNSWMSAYEAYELMVFHTALYGKSFWRIVSGERGFCSELWPLHPSRMTVSRMSDGTIGYKYLSDRTTWDPVDPSKILAVRWLSDNGYDGMVPSELCAKSVALARKLDTAATSFWDNSARPDLVLETTETIPDEAVEALRQQLREIYGGAANRGSAAVLPKKMTLKPIDSNSNEQSQFMELRSALVSECARAYGVPSTLIGDSQMAKYSNVEQEHLSAQVWCLLPWQRRIEGAIERSILTPYIDNGDDVYLKLDSRGLLRADSSGRAALYQTLSNLGAITPNEIRDLEDLPLLDDPAADQTYMQQGFAPLAVVAQGLDQQGGGNGNGP
ncbi:MAG: phage portal protein [Planctomycetia bacterium]|nr:phage portal protein [Planctomycetia bacterium]